MTIRDWDSRGGNWRLQVLTQEAVLAEWQQFLDHLVEMDVMNAPSVKRLVDGKILAGALGVKPGKWTGMVSPLSSTFSVPLAEET
ncbi:hypothetical protein QBC40DRAFT_253223 [Triangularia verruculosa]|uniref:Uncharacterized protein n=1 Tax=Triangularia verruculosa TaxID=2587418 RepID=A0AAN7AWF0_9PEZI|nr:hypothetical protein QBC40DRAFT_253223 [Triangularia verruculosa]